MKKREKKRTKGDLSDDWEIDKTRPPPTPFHITYPFVMATPSTFLGRLQQTIQAQIANLTSELEEQKIDQSEDRSVDGDDGQQVSSTSRAGSVITARPESALSPTTPTPFGSMNTKNDSPISLAHADTADTFSPQPSGIPLSAPAGSSSFSQTQQIPSDGTTEHSSNANVDDSYNTRGKKKSRKASATFVIVRPPPTTAPKKQMNLQIQLVMGNGREKKRKGVSPRYSLTH